MQTITAIPAPKVIGPYSRWPRQTRARNWQLPMTAVASGTVTGVAVHCAPYLF